MPSAQDLVRGVGLKPPGTATGIYRNVDDRNHVHMRFAYRAPNRWSWFHVDLPLSGFVSDGTTHVVVEEGSAAIVTTEGDVHTTHRLRNLFNPRAFDWNGWRLREVSRHTAIGRPAWMLRAEPTMPGKAVTEQAFDQSSGVLLFMKTNGNYLGFDELTINEPIEDDVFRWHGPIARRRIGTVHISKGARGYSGSWQVSVRGRLLYSLEAPANLMLDDLRAWAEERAEEVLVRED